MRKSTTRQVASPAAKPARVKTAVCISPEAFQRIGACCIKENMTQSEVIELLVNRSLSGYVVSVRGDRLRDSATQANTSVPVAELDRLSSDDHVSDTHPKLAV